MNKKSKSKGIYFLIFLILLGFLVYYVYQHYFLNSTHFKDKNYVFIYIERDDSFEDVMNTLRSEDVVENYEAFQWMAKQMQLGDNIHPGKFRITNGMNARQIINLLKYNKQERVKLTYNSQIHNLNEFIEYTELKLEMTEEELDDILSNEKRLGELFQMNPDNCFAMITPGVYEVSWSISTEELMQLFKAKYKKVWTLERQNRAKRMGYTIAEIITMASIVQSESSIETEQEKIAGVYFNRLEQGMLLQADPTLKFANGNFEARRVLDEDKETNSPYNTYKFKGLPPGPICLVTLGAISATLNYNKHKYIFFCAKPGLNGYSDFSVNYAQHRKFAQAYQKAMDKKGIER